MKQLNWHQIFGNVHKIPDGRTVTPTDDIQIWLNCANIWDKTYITLAEVLADTDTLSALINSENAVDYMVRSTTWASGTCADSTAMSYIGLNNYCANTLLADSTWRAAILASTYVLSVLNDTVPKMTSTTTPEGVTYSNSTYGGEGGGFSSWKAFNNSESWGWLPNSNGAYVNYTFDHDTTIYYAVVSRQAGGTAATSTCKFRAYNSSDDKVDQSTNFSLSTGSSNVKKVFTNPGKYRCNEFVVVSDSNLAGGTGYKIQFYGRKDV